MAAQSTYTLDETHSSTLTRTTGGTVLVFGAMGSTTTAQTIIAGDSKSFKLPAGAAATCPIWPQEIIALAANTAIHFRLQFKVGTTDTTKAQRGMTIELGATPDVLETWGQPVEFTSDAIIAVDLIRGAGGNEEIEVEVIWYVFSLI